MKISKIIVLFSVVTFCIVCSGIAKGDDDCSVYYGGSGGGIGTGYVEIKKPLCPQGANPVKDNCCPVAGYFIPPDQQSEPTRKQKMLEEKQKLLDQQNAQDEKGTKAQDKEQSIKYKGRGDESWVEFDATGNSGSKPSAEIQKRPRGEQIPRELPPPDPRPVPVPDPGKERPKLRPDDGTNASSGKDSTRFPEGMVPMKVADGERSTNMPPGNSSGGWLDAPPADQQSEPVTNKQKMLEEKEKLLNQQNRQKEKGTAAEGREQSTGTTELVPPPTYIYNDEKPKAPSVVDPSAPKPAMGTMQPMIQQRPPDEIIPGKIPPPDPRPLPVPDQGREMPKFRPGEGTVQSGGQEK